MLAKTTIRRQAEQYGLLDHFTTERERLKAEGKSVPEAWRLAYERIVKPAVEHGQREPEPEGGHSLPPRPTIGDERLTIVEEMRWGLETIGHYRATREWPKKCPCKGAWFWFDLGLAKPDYLGNLVLKTAMRGEEDEGEDWLCHGKQQQDELERFIAEVQAALPAGPQGPPGKPAVAA